MASLQLTHNIVLYFRHNIIIELCCMLHFISYQSENSVIDKVDYVRSSEHVTLFYRSHIS